IIQELRRQQATLASQYVDLHSYLAEKHLRSQARDAQKADIQRRINEETQKIVNSLRSDYKSAVEHENSLQSELEELKQESVRMQIAEVTLKQLEEEERADRALYTNFLERAKETSRTDFEIPEAVLISHAASPLSPFYPKKKLILAFGFLLSALTGFLVAAAREAMDRSFRSQAHIEKALGVAALGVIPEFPRHDPSGTLNVLSLGGSGVTGIYMRLRLNTSHCPLVAYALPGEGKTTAALLRARIAAVNGKRVLVVDGDLRRSGLREWLPVKGLSDVLAGQAEITDTIVTEARGVHVITCGNAVDNPAGVLASAAMR